MKKWIYKRLVSPWYLPLKRFLSVRLVRQILMDEAYEKRVVGDTLEVWKDGKRVMSLSGKQHSIH